MSYLLSDTMLPKLKTSIPQVKDLLFVEDKFLEVVIDLLSYLEERTVLLKAQVMNIPNIKMRIKAITGLDCEILEDAENLTLIIRYFFDTQVPEFEFEERILSSIPAHLKVITEFLKKYSGEIRLKLGSAYIGNIKYIVKPMEMNKKTIGEFLLPLKQYSTQVIRYRVYPKGD